MTLTAPRPSWRLDALKITVPESAMRAYYQSTMPMRTSLRKLDARPFLHDTKPLPIRENIASRCSSTKTLGTDPWALNATIQFEFGPGAFNHKSQLSQSLARQPRASLIHPGLIRAAPPKLARNTLQLCGTSCDPQKRCAAEDVILGSDAARQAHAPVRNGKPCRGR